MGLLLTVNTSCRLYEYVLATQRRRPIFAFFPGLLRRVSHEQNPLRFIYRSCCIAAAFTLSTTVVVFK